MDMARKGGWAGGTADFLYILSVRILTRGTWLLVAFELGWGPRPPLFRQLAEMGEGPFERRATLIASVSELPFCGLVEELL